MPAECNGFVAIVTLNVNGQLSKCSRLQPEALMMIQLQGCLAAPVLKEILSTLIICTLVIASR